MKPETLILERLKELLFYDPVTGHFTWVARVRGIRTGSRAGSRTTSGYRIIKLDGRFYYAHRLAWFWIHGVMPKRIKVLNGDPDDSRIENLADSFMLPRRYDHRTKEGRSEYMAEYRSTRRRHLSDKERERTFGITPERYAEMVAEQNGLCAICGKPECETRNGKVKALAVDHDHESGRIRGLLCVACNTGLGKLGDDPVVLRKAADYVERHGH